MNSIKLFLILSAYVLLAEAFFFDGGVTVVGGGAALAGLLGLKAAALGGFALGAALNRGSRRRYTYRRRWGRSVEDESEMIAEVLLEASRNDADDCAKKLVCVLNAQENLAEDEAKIAQLFGKNDSIDVTSAAVEFDLAALMGKKAGEKQCHTIYSRCQYQVRDLMDVIRQPFYNQL